MATLDIPPRSGGLDLEANPARGRHGRWRSRNAGQEKRLAMGTCPEVTLAGGTDPAQVRADTRTAARLRTETHFEGVARAWFEHWKGPRPDRHAGSVLRRLERDVFPVLGHKPVGEITAPQLPAMAKRIEARGALEIAKRALQTWGQVLRVAVRRMAWRSATPPPSEALGRAQGVKMHTPHIVPLSRQAIDVLPTLHEQRNALNDLVFPGERSHEKPMSNNTILKALERMGCKHRMTGHGLRGIASTILHELGHRHDVIELQRAHQERNALSAAYNHATCLEERHVLMRAWADHLDALRRGSTVLAFRASSP